MPAELHSIYDLTTFCRKTTGHVPPKLVGASTTVVGSKMYLFGGRLVTERRMVADLYVFDLETYNWEIVPPFPEDDIPRPRYFHSVDTWNNQLILFGGMSNEPDSPNPDELCVLNDVRFFDLSTFHWLPAGPSPPPASPLTPRARYAQLSSVTGDRLFIIGGQDFYNTWLDDVCVYDLLAKTWCERRDYPRHCGSYRSVAVSASQVVRNPKDEMRRERDKTTTPIQAGPRFQVPGQTQPELDQDSTPTENLVHLPHSAAPNDEHPSDIYLYSNYNVGFNSISRLLPLTVTQFTDVKRELEIFSPLPDTGFNVTDRSAAMTGPSLPPGLRFPSGAILGNHLIIAGIYLAHSYQSFSIWVLDLTTMAWSRIDPGKAVESGSWFRGCLWPEGNRFFVFGNRNGNLVDDYNRRLLSWEHVAVVDLEAFGIYQPPSLRLDVPMQEMGLAALEEGVLADFEVICDDGRKIRCSRKLLEERWPWFKEQRLKLLQNAMGAMEALPSAGGMHVSLPSLPGNLPDGQRPDPRLTPRALHLSEPYPITLALLQYLYSTALLTPLQTAPAVLSQLLVISTNYKLDHLSSLLQIRALKTVMSYTQKKPSRRTEKENSGGGGGGGSGAGLERDQRSGGGGESRHTTRPRGTSDARWATSTTDSGMSNGRGYGYSNASYPVFSDDADDLFTRPDFTKSRLRTPPAPIAVGSHRRTPSNVSLHTEAEIQEVVELMSPAPASPPTPMSPRTAGRTRLTEQAFMDRMFESLMHPYMRDPGYESEPEEAETHSVSPWSESESDFASMATSPGSDSLSPGGFIPYHLPRRGLETPSLITSSSRSSLLSSSSHGRDLSSPMTPPMSPETAFALPSIDEHYTDDGSERAMSPPALKVRTEPMIVLQDRTRTLSPTPSDTETLSAVTSRLSLDPKSQKAEEKRLKKVAAKARTEELARQLKERARKAKEDASERNSNSSREKKAEPVAMYGGVVAAGGSSRMGFSL
ncbi:unnamed protein product [Mycena citricolor]|uniref:Galactose oxidase n=1 Tax=Mycena citricolor TaxID=2018698 RepID=A0AAD2K7X4_9AGAR|nr:unnamed protein product [Mycena citricolor]